MFEAKIPELQFLNSEDLFFSLSYVILIGLYWVLGLLVRQNNPETSSINLTSKATSDQFYASQQAKSIYRVEVEYNPHNRTPCLPRGWVLGFSWLGWRSLGVSGCGWRLCLLSTPCSNGLSYEAKDRPIKREPTRWWPKKEKDKCEISCTDGQRKCDKNWAQAH